ncbi:hypothetical protein TW95_gp0461 [Pandoravirus inopinatum]|uniref:Uncharacterized protein n=1 Tax=Pandoravirus inopinatum TaxID=1605721 RepID=A0A0B5J663_9VIRU|nr:hypothetical protein TW95_gp0461 [Pandoravirus inopinatum]AJF97195.1 hypothetical protein [Pandoravirus inopinatum]
MDGQSDDRERESHVGRVAVHTRERRRVKHPTDRQGKDSGNSQQQQEVLLFIDREGCEWREVRVGGLSCVAACRCKSEYCYVWFSNAFARRRPYFYAPPLAWPFCPILWGVLGVVQTAQRHARGSCLYGAVAMVRGSVAGCRFWARRPGRGQADLDGNQTRRYCFVNREQTVHKMHKNSHLGSRSRPGLYFLKSFLCTTQTKADPRPPTKTGTSVSKNALFLLDAGHREYGFHLLVF